MFSALVERATIQPAARWRARAKYSLMLRAARDRLRHRRDRAAAGVLEQRPARRDACLGRSDLPQPLRGVCRAEKQSSPRPTTTPGAPPSTSPPPAPSVTVADMRAAPSAAHRRGGRPPRRRRSAPDTCIRRSERRSCGQGARSSSDQTAKSTSPAIWSACPAAGRRPCISPRISGVKPVYREDIDGFVPGAVPAGQFGAGAMMGTYTTADAIENGHRAGIDAALYCGKSAPGAGSCEARSRARPSRSLLPRTRLR